MQQHVGLPYLGMVGLNRYHVSEVGVWLREHYRSPTESIGTAPTLSPPPYISQTSRLSPLRGPRLFSGILNLIGETGFEPVTRRRSFR